MVAFSGYGDPGAGAVVEPKPIVRMPILKEVTSSSTVSWCPLESHKDFLAAGTVSGTIDDSFQTSSRLLILNTSLSDRSSDMKVLGQARVKDADFVRISWGAKGSSDSSMPLGLVAGGMSDGSLLLWNAENVINGSNRTPIAAKRHGSHVSGLSFHPTEQNLIASGSADSELLIWDLKNVSSPIASPPGASMNTEKSSIVDLAWNLKVPHILACSSSNGQTSVWDLRQKRAVFTFTESTHRHIPATAVAWDPTQARQLVVSYAHPVAEVWDLRYGMAPKQLLQNGHTRGSILTVAWSQFDSNIILTTGEDATSCIWNAQDGQLLDCVQDRGTTFCLKWHPFNAELLAGSTYEGNVTVRSISNTGSHVPEWKGRPCGAIFGFGSRLVTFGNGYTQGSVRCFKVSTEPEFIRMASEFQSDISHTDMKSFCTQKIAKSNHDTDEKTTWEFIQLMFESDSRVRFLSHLGFPPSQAQRSSLTALPNGGIAHAPIERLDEVSDEDFFNQLSPGEKNDSSPDADAFNGVFSPISNVSSPAKFAVKQEEPEVEASDLDKSINSMLVVGDIERAANLCVKNNRMADALAIASLGSAELQTQIHEFYMSTHKNHYIRSIASSIASKDIPSYIKRSDVSLWRETLALIITYCPPEQYVSTVRILVDRLDAAGMNQAAIVCCLCCSDIDGAALQWQKQEHQRSGKSRIDTLQASVEKLYVMSQACGQTTGPSASGLYAEYAGLLSAQGAMAMALSFLQIAGGGTDELAYRIYYSGVSPQAMPPPPQPFYIKNVSSSGHSAPGRMVNTPGGLRRGPHPSQSSVRDHKPSSVPPQNRMIGSSGAPPMGAPRGQPPSAMRPPYKPTTGFGMTPPGPRPNSVPPQDPSSLPSRHLLDDSSQQAGPTNQFPGPMHGPTASNPSRMPGPSRSGFMPPARSATPPTRPGQGYAPPRPVPTPGRSSPNLATSVRHPVPARAPSPSMAPVPASQMTPNTGRFGPPSVGAPGIGPSAQRVQAPSLSGSNLRQAPSPMGPMGMSQPGPSGQMPRSMPGRPGPIPMGNRMPSPSAASAGPRPGMPPAHHGPMGSLPGSNPSLQQSPGPNRFSSQPNVPTNGPPGPYHPPSNSGPLPVRSAPTRPGMNSPVPALNPSAPPLRPGMNAPLPTQNAQPPVRPQQQPLGSGQNQPSPSTRPAMNAPHRAHNQPPPHLRPGMNASPAPSQSHPPLRPGMNASPAPNQPHPPFRPGMNASPAPNQPHPPFRPGMNASPAPNQSHPPFRPGMNAPNQPHPPFRPGMNASPAPNQSHPPFRHGMNASPAPNQPHPPFRPQAGASTPALPHPGMQGPAHYQGQSQSPFNAGRPGPHASPNSPPGPFRPGMHSANQNPNQPQVPSNPGLYPKDQSHGFFGSADAMPPHQGPIPSRPNPTGSLPSNRPLPTPGHGLANQQTPQQPTYAQSSGPFNHHLLAPMRQPSQNPFHQSASQPNLSASDCFSGDASSAYSLTQPSDPFSSDFLSQQRASAPVIPPVQDSTGFDSTNNNRARSPSPSSFLTEKAHVSPNIQPRSPNQGRLSPSLSGANQQIPRRGSPKRTDDLVALFQTCFSDLHALCHDPVDKAVVDNASGKFEAEVYNRISSGEFSAGAMKSLGSLAKALESHNKSGVQQANIALITDCWAEVKTILPVIKSIVEVCKKAFN